MRTFTVLFLLRPGEILLAMKKRGFGTGHYNGVGGKIEPGETPEQAMIRECEEEIEVTPTTYEKVAEITFNEIHGQERKDVLAHVYTATDWEGKPTETDEMAPEWFSISKIPYDQMWADDPYWLPQILAGGKLVCSFSLDDQNKVFKHSVKEVDTI